MHRHWLASRVARSIVAPLTLVAPFACRDESAPTAAANPSARPAPPMRSIFTLPRAQSHRFGGVEGLFESIADRVPGFAALYFDKTEASRRIIVRVTDLAQAGTAERVVREELDKTQGATAKFSCSLRSTHSKPR